MNYRFLTRTLFALTTIALIAVLSACSLKKNTAASRQYTAFITRYNIYYNGDTHYKETLDEMEKKYEDDYSRLVFTHPAEARADEHAPQPTGDFTRSIEKAQKAIQVRSIKKKPARKAGKASDPEYKAWMKRDEYNPFLHNAWMMMGRSQFLNGDFLGAASTFFYITKHFTWLPETVTEAKIWQARSYCAIDWLFEAEMILTRIKPDELVNKQLRYLYNLTYTDFFINSNKPKEAIPYLVEAVAASGGAQKTRLNFLLGQLYTLAGEKQLAYKAFAKAGSSTSASYRTKFNARIKQSEVFEGEDITSEVKALRRMTRYDRNKAYLDQIYYAIGNLYLSRRDTTQAIASYEEAVKSSTRNGVDKAMTQLTLGGLYYDLGDYVKAQPCYSEALPQVPDTYPDYKALKRRSDFLDELAVYAQNVTLQDSLLKLSYMTPEEQTAVAERLIAELKKKEAEEAELARREEMRANQAAQEDPFGGNASSPTTFTMNSDNSWYFYNQSTVTAGKTDFQRRWGSRKLEDDWRRRNKASYAFDSFNDSEEEDDEEKPDTNGEDTEESADAEAVERQNDPHYVEYYLKQIPKDDRERQIANDVIQEGLYNMGVILKDKLEDFPAARTEFDRLLRRYPDNVYRLDVYYNLYLMAVRQGDMAGAERWRNLIVSDFADSPYGRAMRDPHYIDNLRLMDARQDELYEAAYQAYLDNDNAAVHRAYDEMSRDFPMSKLMPKFMFINALAYVTENKPEQFKETLTEMLQRYPDTDLTPYAAAYIKGLDAGRKLNSGSANMRGMLWDIRLSNDDTAPDADNPLEFELNPDDEQLFILLYPTDKVAPNQLLYDIARHNFTSFVVKDFDLEQMNFGRLGLLIIKPFANVAEVNHYRSVLQADAALQLPPQVRPVVISAKNFDTLLHGGGSFEDYFRYVEDKTYRDTEERVLPPEFFGPSEGIIEENESEPSPQSTQSAQSAQTSPTSPTGLTGPTSPTESEPAANAVEPAVPAPAPQPQPQPATTPTPPAPTPPAPAPKPAPAPALPDYPAGSEGDDDPLLD
ncbi:MAG: tetratricopeptide repeat protein [Muribaculaceae bacterium]|nr:tetratricopeptide repeat protein [Muribaculaceae bacterium]